MARKPKTDPRQQIIDAALALAGEQGWRALTLDGIARHADVSLAELHGQFRSKSAILGAFIDRIDQAVLEGCVPEDRKEPARDRLFDVMMRRFDALGPYKDGVRAIVREGGDGTFLGTVAAGCRMLRAMGWMLEGAGISTAGWRGRLRIKGLAAIHMSVMRRWLADDSADLTQTMAALDKALRRAETWQEGIDRLCGRHRPAADVPPDDAPSPAQA